MAGNGYTNGMKIDPTTRVSLRFDPVPSEWFLQETVKESTFTFRSERISPNYSSLPEAEEALAALLEVYDAAIKG
jgi:hypothetical protein